MKLRTISLLLMCIIFLTLLGCSTENAWVRKIVKNNIDIQTKFGDELHFDIHSAANLHHEFIKYRISLSSVAETENNVASIVLRDQPETVYDDPLSVFSEIISEENISLYRLENYYIFIYDDRIITYPHDDNLFKGYAEIDVIKRFKDVVLNNEV